MRGTKSLPAIAILVALLTSLPAGLASSSSSSASVLSVEWTDHGAIFINDDSKFTSENGVVSGDGTKSDPYIIEGWRIGQLSDRTAIVI